VDGCESLSHTKWDCKYHVVFIPKYRRKGAVREAETVPGRCVPQVGFAEGKPDRGRPPDAGSWAHDDIDPAEIRSFAGGRFHKGQERDPLGPEVWRDEAQFRGTELLGQRVLRIDGRSRQNQEQEDKRLDQLNLWR
jgi:hypothetical protein